MSKSQRPKTVNYRRCSAENPTAVSGAAFNLQELLTRAEAQNKRPWIRKLTAGGARKQFLTYLIPKQGCLCGVLVLYEDGKLVPLVDAEKDGSTWEGSAAPKDDKGRKRQLQEHAIYFAVRENHVAAIQSKELGISDLQDFLCWFIQSEAKLANGWIFVLQNLPSREAVEKLKNQRIKGITIGKQAFKTVRTEIPGKPDAKRKRYTKTISSDPVVMQWLRSVLADDALVDELEGSQDPGSVEVDLEIRYRSRSEKDAQQVMKALAANLGGLDDVNTEIKLEGKSRIKGSELTIADQLQIQAPQGIISGDDAMTRIAEWLNESIKSGKVFPG